MSMKFWEFLTLMLQMQMLDCIWDWSIVLNSTKPLLILAYQPCPPPPQSRCLKCTINLQINKHKLFVKVIFCMINSTPSENMTTSHFHPLRLHLLSDLTPNDLSKLRYCASCMIMRPLLFEVLTRYFFFIWLATVSSCRYVYISHMTLRHFKAGMFPGSHFSLVGHFFPYLWL